MKFFLREILGTVLLAVVVYLLLQATVQSFIVVGTSMKPSLYDEQRILVNKLVYHLQEPESGDVIVFRPLNEGEEDYVKRIIGLPGDTVEIKQSTVYINGSPLSEPYIADQPSYTLSARKIPEGNYFVLGDNRNHSNDSHTGWTVPRENIVGKAWLSIWPPSRWGIINDYDLREQLTSAATA